MNPGTNGDSINPTISRKHRPTHTFIRKNRFACGRYISHPGLISRVFVTRQWK